ncbi:hypothetical protein [Rhodococcus sp. IEGM 1379]|uniref:hypothetical protein n=1 Tax=Rhodococcus sp. IEGM 1379 TaxID=3047086 RepID=UPI0024B82DF0|nr:hypothetical protein [Rhodococcus sp. IEGM 1379]MDI9915823.1 hypothetical protein [Rhodococcus sp. IEGM 1379]
MNRSVRAAVTLVVAGVSLVALSTVSGAAPPDNGQRDAQVNFWATDRGACEADFTIENHTNVTTYTIDWRIDGEAGRDIGVGFDVYRTGTPNMSSKALSPTWPDEVPENTPENRTMLSGLPAVSATYTQDLKNIIAGWNPALPNPDADTHTVEYRMVLGPPGNNGQTPSELPEWIGDRAWHTVTVTGCNPPPETGSLGSSSWLGSIFGGSTGSINGS